MKLAVIDLGTNTCRLLLAEVRDGAITHTELRRTEVVRLGEGVDRTGSLAAAAVQRTLVRLREYATLIEGYAPERRLLIATSALRDAADGRRFLSRVERELGLPWRVIGGEEEAALAFRGAVACTPVRSGRILVFDIGGGSTELAIGITAPDSASRTTRRAVGCVDAGRAPRPEHSWSLDVGAVRLTERFLTSDPPTIGQWRQAMRHTRTLFCQALSQDERQVDAGIGVAGTITTLVANHLGLREYRTDLVHGRELSLATIEAAICAFRPLTSAARALLPGIEPGREDVILAGALIAREVCRSFGLSSVLCSEADILEGAILTLAEERD
jgi:exopolyphosphatase/guanosine-5'-triphosphate,3'-diphosphate pyrophosphatase